MTVVAAVIIPFRDRGVDVNRSLNMQRVLQHWEDDHGMEPFAVSDGRSDRELFNRSAAYNRGITVALQDLPDYDAYIFTESDMLVDPEQVDQALDQAMDRIGMVVPFSTYCYHSPESSMHIRNGKDPEDYKPRWKMDNCTSIGAINVVSRATMDAVGWWDEKFEGNWYDDDAMKLAFDLLTAPTRFIEGKAHHLYHLPGHRGVHLTNKEKDATAANQRRLGLYERAAREKNCAQMRRLLKGEG